MTADPHLKATAWRTAIAGLLTLATLMGIGRFAFTPLLPMMMHDQSVTLNEGGWLATANFIGYFAGAAICMMWRFTPVNMVRSGLITTVILTICMAVLNDLWVWLLLRFLAGMASAWGFVYATTWFLQRLTQLQHPALAGIIYCGPGLGIFVTGISADSMIAHAWPAAYGWMTFGILALLFTMIIWRTLIDTPIVFPQSAVIAPHSRFTSAKHETQWQALSYGMAGLGYIISATFLPIIARQAMPNSLWFDLFWPLFGISIAIGALISTRIPVYWDQRLLLAGGFIMQTIGVLLCVLVPTETGFALSSIFLGTPFTAITLFAMREARRLSNNNPSRLIALMTTTYSVGQIIGPPLATHLVTLTGSFNPSLAIAAGALLLGAAIYTTLALRDRVRSNTSL